MKRTLLLIIILGVLFRIAASQPTWIHLDEGYYINIFQNFVDRGELTPYMWRIGSQTNIIAGGGTGYGIYLLIGWMKVFGESLFAIRMLMLLAGLVSAWVYYLVSKKWWDSQEAGVAALVFGLVSTSAFYSFVGRMDALAILAYSLLLLLHIWAVRQEKKWPHFLVGAAAILTAELHMLGLLYVAALALFYGVQYVEMVKRDKRIVLDAGPVYYFLGAGILGVLYIVVHILPDPEAYFLISTSCPFCYPSRIKTEFYRFILLLMYRPQELLLTLFVIYFAFKERKANQHFFLLLLGYFVAQLIFSPPPNVSYANHFLPLLALGTARLVTYAISRIRIDQQDFLKKILLGAALIMLCLNLVLPVAADWLPYETAMFMPETAEIDYILENIPTSAVVMSTVHNFYPLREYRSFLQFAPNLQYGLTLRGEHMLDFLKRIDPQVVYLPPDSFEGELELRQFMDGQDYVHVLPELWVTREFIPDK